jgi:signal transduction histidine kinase
MILDTMTYSIMAIVAVLSVIVIRLTCLTTSCKEKRKHKDSGG